MDAHMSAVATDMASQGSDGGLLDGSVLGAGRGRGSFQSGDEISPGLDRVKFKTSRRI